MKRFKIGDTVKLVDKYDRWGITNDRIGVDVFVIGNILPPSRNFDYSTVDGWFIKDYNLVLEKEWVPQMQPKMRVIRD
jgi:hypothetical protein